MAGSHGLHRHDARQPGRRLRGRRAPDRRAGPRTGHDRGRSTAPSTRRSTSRLVERVAAVDGVAAVAARVEGYAQVRRAGRRGRRRHRHGRGAGRCRLDRRRAAQPVPAGDRTRRRAADDEVVVDRSLADEADLGAGRPGDGADRVRTGRRDRGRHRDASATPTTGRATAPCCSRLDAAQRLLGRDGQRRQHRGGRRGRCQPGRRWRPRPTRRSAATLEVDHRHRARRGEQQRARTRTSTSSASS